METRAINGIDGAPNGDQVLRLSQKQCLRLWEWGPCASLNNRASDAGFLPLHPSPVRGSRTLRGGVSRQPAVAELQLGKTIPVHLKHRTVHLLPLERAQDAAQPQKLSRLVDGWAVDLLELAAAAEAGVVCALVVCGGKRDARGVREMDVLRGTESMCVRVTGQVPSKNPMKDPSLTTKTTRTESRSAQLYMRPG